MPASYDRLARGEAVHGPDHEGAGQVGDRRRGCPCRLHRARGRHRDAERGHGGEPRRRSGRAEQPAGTGAVRAGQADLPLRHVRRRGVLGGRASAAHGDRGGGARRGRAGSEPEDGARRRPQGRLGRASPLAEAGSRGRPSRPRRSGHHARAPRPGRGRRPAGVLRPRPHTALDRDHLRLLPLHGRRLVRAGHRETTRRLAEPRPQRGRDRRAGAEQEADHGPAAESTRRRSTPSSPPGARASTTRSCSWTARRSAPTESRLRPCSRRPSASPESTCTPTRAGARSPTGTRWSRTWRCTARARSSTRASTIP